MASLEHLAAVEQLSLCGLVARLDLADRLKEITKPTEEEAAALASEVPAKKAVAELLPVLCAKGLTPKEKALAKEFLQRQVKSVDSNSRGADARLAKLRELLAAVQAAASAEGPAHVEKARALVSRAEKDFEDIHKSYEKWEKGKQMLSVDELKVMKRSHDEAQHRLDGAKAFYELQVELRPEAAATPPASLLAQAARSGAGSAAAAGRAGKAAAKAGPAAVRGGGPAVRTLGAAGAAASGYPAAGALRQAQLVAAVRAEAAAELPAEAPRPRPAPRPKVVEGPGPVLSYACTCAAVAEQLGISADEARELASSSSEFGEKLGLAPEAWAWVQERSLAIEREQREKQKEAEKRKQEAAKARRDKEVQKAEAVASAAAAPKAAAKPVPGAVAKAPAAAKAKAKAKAPAAPKVQVLEGLAGGNRFGGFESSDEEQDG